MAQFKEPGSPNLQELIDSYNDEIMRYSRMASPIVPSEGARESSDRQPEKGEFEREGGMTERMYWNGDGKYGILRDENEHYGGNSDYSSGLIQPREAYDFYENAGASRSAEQPNRSASVSEREQWQRDLEQGLLDLKRGLEELAEGQRELREGQLAYERGAAERDFWRSQGSASAAVSHSADDPPFVPPQPHSQVGAVPQNPPNIPPAQSPTSIPSDGEGVGYLRVAVVTARQSAPVPGALVRVFAPTPQGNILIASAVTNEDGKIPPLSLPTGLSSTSNESYASPFFNYDVSVTADGYYPRDDLIAQIFNGVTGYLTVDMIPLPEFDRSI